MIKEFKIFESGENYEVLATNKSYYSWEYDNQESTAQILLDKSDDSLYLKIHKVHVKTGLGAGTYPMNAEFVCIGTLQKADLALVRKLLKKHQYDQRKFSTHWEDEEGNKMSLTDLLKMHKPEKPKRQLKHIEPISKFQEVEKPTDQEIELVQYSDRSYALFGEGTKEIKDELKNLGCRYNKFLTDPKTGQKRPGWIFSISKLDKIKDLIN